MDAVKPRKVGAFLKILAVSGAHQDEAELRAAERMAQDRSVACAELQSRMRKNTVYCRQHFADAKRTLARFEENQGELQEALDGAAGAELELEIMKKNAMGDCEIEEKRSHWNDCLTKFMIAAEGASAETTNDNADTDELSKLLCEHLALGEPTTQGAAVVLYHPVAPKSEILKVTHAMGQIELKTGQILRYKAKKNTPLAQAVLNVVQTGHPVLSNPHGVTSGLDAVSIVPLYDSQRSIIGAVVSGPSAVPDEFVERFSRLSAQMFERIGRLEVVWRTIKYIESFIQQQCENDRKLVYVKFEKDKSPSPPTDEWLWQPLKYTNPGNEKRFELPLAWSQGEVIGLFTVECATFTAMDEGLIAMLHTLAPILLEAVRDIETMELGTEPYIQGMNSLMETYERKRIEVATILSEELSSQVKMSVIFNMALVETASYLSKVTDKKTLNMVKAALALANFPPTKDLKEILKQVKNTKVLCAALSSADLTVRPKGDTKKEKQARAKQDDRWNRADVCLKDLDLDNLSLRSPVPVKILIRWLKAARMVQRIGTALAMPSVGMDPMAQEIFLDIDKNHSAHGCCSESKLSAFQVLHLKPQSSLMRALFLSSCLPWSFADGALSTQEIIAYLLKDSGCDAEQALKFVRVLDTNGDGNVSPVEWHEAWQHGQFQIQPPSPTNAKKVTLPEQSGKMPTKPKPRLTSKHLSMNSVLEPIEDSSSKKKKGKGSSKKIIPAGAPAGAPPMRVQLDVSPTDGDVHVQ